MHERDLRVSFAAVRPVVLRDPAQHDPELVAVARGHEEVVGRFVRVAEHMREGGRRERDPVVRDPEPQGLRVARAPAHEDDGALLHELRVELLGPVDLVAVVLVDEPDRPALDAAPRVEPVDVPPHRVGVVDPHVGRRTREVEDGRDQNLVFRPLPRTPACSERENRGDAAGSRPGHARSVEKHATHLFLFSKSPNFGAISGLLRGGTRRATRRSSLSRCATVWTDLRARRRGRG